MQFGAHSYRGAPICDEGSSMNSVDGGHLADRETHKFLQLRLAPGLPLPNGTVVSYQEGNFLGTWFGEDVIVSAKKLTSESVLQYGIEEAIYRLLADHAPITKEEYRRYGHKTLNVDAILTHWVSRLSRIYPVNGYQSDWVIGQLPTPQEFTARWGDGLVRIEPTTTRRVAHESVAYGIEFLQDILQDEFIITEDTSIAVFEQATRAVVIGHHKFIERLCAHTAHRSRPLIATDLDALVR